MICSLHTYILAIKLWDLWELGADLLQLTYLCVQPWYDTTTTIVHSLFYEGTFYLLQSHNPF
jgi:hypothetical protein